MDRGVDIGAGQRNDLHRVPHPRGLQDVPDTSGSAQIHRDMAWEANDVAGQCPIPPDLLTVRPLTCGISGDRETGATQDECSQSRAVEPDLRPATVVLMTTACAPVVRARSRPTATPDVRLPQRGEPGQQPRRDRTCRRGDGPAGQRRRHEPVGRDGHRRRCVRPDRRVATHIDRVGGDTGGSEIPGEQEEEIAVSVRGTRIPTAGVGRHRGLVRLIGGVVVQRCRRGVRDRHRSGSTPGLHHVPQDVHCLTRPVAVPLGIDPVPRPLLRHPVGLVEESRIPRVAVGAAPWTGIRAVPPPRRVIARLRRSGAAHQPRFLLQRREHHLRVHPAGPRYLPDHGGGSLGRRTDVGSAVPVGRLISRVHPQLSQAERTTAPNALHVQECGDLLISHRGGVVEHRIGDDVSRIENCHVERARSGCGGDRVRPGWRRRARPGGRRRARRRRGRAWGIATRVALRCCHGRAGSLDGRPTGIRWRYRLSRSGRVALISCWRLIGRRHRTGCGQRDGRRRRRRNRRTGPCQDCGRHCRRQHRGSPSKRSAPLLRHLRRHRGQPVPMPAPVVVLGVHHPFGAGDRVHRPGVLSPIWPVPVTVTASSRIAPLTLLGCAPTSPTSISAGTVEVSPPSVPRTVSPT